MKFELLLGSGGNNFNSSIPNTGNTIRFEPNTTNTIYLNGVSAGWGINIGTPAATKGDRIVGQTFKSGASTYDWAVSDSGFNWDIAVGAWSTTSGLNVARNYLAGCGDTNSALSFGGNTGAVVATTEKWSGTSWATTSALNQARRELAGCGDTNSALSFGGHTGANVATTEKWSGTSWATASALNQDRSYLAGCGDTNNALSLLPMSAPN